MGFDRLVMVDLVQKEKAIGQLLEKMEEKIMFEEHSLKPLKGVGNLSRSDLEMTVMYTQQLIRNGGCGFGPMVNPTDNVEKLFKAYKII